jgi:hypothetical protein
VNWDGHRAVGTRASKRESKKISEHTSHERDLTVMTLIWNVMGRYQKAMIVYGDSHNFQEEQASFSTPVH